METPLNLLYTYDIRGELRLLPRLYTFIKSLRASLEGSCYLVDLGNSCAPDVWPCNVTEGRATLVALDAMGYAVANVQGILSAASRHRLVEQVTLAMVDDEHAHQQDGVMFHSQKDPSLRLRDAVRYDVILAPAQETRYHNGVVTLQAVATGQVGVVGVADNVVYRDIYTMPPQTLPDATISGAVDFIESEARYFEKRGKRNGNG
jgi:hypothetical protein